MRKASVSTDVCSQTQQIRCQQSKQDQTGSSQAVKFHQTDGAGFLTRQWAGIKTRQCGTGVQAGDDKTVCEPVR